MKRSFLLGSLLLATVLAAPRSEAASFIAELPTDRIALPPVYLQHVSRDGDLDAAISRFQRKQVSGDAIVSCEVTVRGALDDCRVVEENPPKTGYGAEAIWLIRNDLFAPARDEHGPFPDRVQIQMIWTIGGSKSPEGSSEGRAKLVTRPVWASAPTFAHVALAFAGTTRPPTLVKVRCEVSPDGLIGPCPLDPKIERDRGLAVPVGELFGLFRMDMSKLNVAPRTPLLVDLAIQTVDPSSEAFKARGIANPVWVDGLDAQRARELYPSLAKARNVQSGVGRAECVVTADGGLSDCRPGEADPPGLGFSEAAVKMASGMRMSRWTAAGGPVDGARITIPLRFDLGAVPQKSNANASGQGG